MGGANAFRPMFRSYQNVAQVQAPDLTTVLDNVLNNAITRENTQANIDKLKYDLEFARQADPLRLKTAAAELDKLVMENNSYNDRLASELGLRNAQTEHYKATTANIPIENEQKWAQIRNQGRASALEAKNIDLALQQINDNNAINDLRGKLVMFAMENSDLKEDEILPAFFNKYQVSDTHKGILASFKPNYIPQNPMSFNQAVKDTPMWGTNLVGNVSKDNDPDSSLSRVRGINVDTNSTKKQ